MCCSVCGLIRAQVDPDKKELANIYQKGYFFGDEYHDYIQDKKGLELNFSKRIKNLKPYLKKDITCIELGCCYGFFLNLLRPHVKKVVGYDITKEGIEYTKKEFLIEAYCDSFLNYKGIPVDLIVMWDVIEHLDKPADYLTTIHKNLKKGGHLALTTGDIGSMMARIQGKKWRLIHPPTHLFYFNKESITKLLTVKGFKVLSIKYYPIFRNFGSVGYQFEKIYHIPLVNKIIQRTFLKKINFGVNLYDIMEVIAEKI